MGNDRLRARPAPGPERRLFERRRPPGAPLARVVAAALLCMTAEAAAADPSSAEQLFQQGVAALHAGQHAEACPAIEQSYVAEPRLGTLLALADCFDKWGKSLSALLRHEQVITEIARLEPEQRRYRAPQLEYARQAAARLRQTVPRLSLVLPPGSAADEIELWLDGQPRPLPGTDAVVRVDPGPHTLETRARGRASWTHSLEIGPGEEQRVALQLGAPDAALVPAAARVRPLASPLHRQALPPSSGAEPELDGSLWRSLGWGLGGLGLAGVAAGSVAGILLLDACPELTCERGDERPRDLALATDIGFGVGLVGLVSAAIILVQTAPDPDRATPSWSGAATLGPDAAWLGLSRAW